MGGRIHRLSLMLGACLRFAASEIWRLSQEGSIV
jgi:hypothetical protein